MGISQEITVSCKIMLQAIWKAQGPLNSPLDIIRHVSIQHVTCDCLFQRRNDARDNWRLEKTLSLRDVTL